MNWQPIATAPKEIGEMHREVQWGPWLALSGAGQQAKGRWRHDVRAYDVINDRMLFRAGVWWGEDDRALPFEPEHWAHLGASGQMR